MRPGTITTIIAIFLSLFLLPQITYAESDHADACPDSNVIECELINNGNFDTDVTGWLGRSCTPTYDNGTLLISGIIPGNYIWDAAVIQGDFALVQGREYTVSFDAFATANREMLVKVGLNITPYSTYFSQLVNLSTSSQHFSYTFTVTDPSTPSGAIDFQFGGDDIEITIDNISISATDCSCPVAGTPCDDGNINTTDDEEDGNCNCVGTPVTGACELIANGTFNTNLNNWYSRSCAPEYAGGEMYITGIVPGTNIWDAAVGQNPFTLVQGRIYTLTFDASASGMRNMAIKIGLSFAPFTEYFYDTVVLTTTSQFFSINFTMEAPSTTIAAVDFQIGASGLDVFLDNVSITATECDCPPAGTSCNDWNTNTINDMEDGNCNCIGTPFIDSCQLVTNGTFDVNTDNWFWWNCTPELSGNQIWMHDILGTNPWEASMSQTGIALTEGFSYQIQFDAYASGPRPLDVRIGLAIEPFTSFSYQSVNLTTTTQTFTLTFMMMDPGTADGSFEFYLGGNNADVWIDNISLKEVGCGSSCPSQVDVVDPIITGTYEAAANVSSGAVVPSGTTVIFRAGIGLDLIPGFEVETGADFTGEIGGCEQ